MEGVRGYWKRRGYWRLKASWEPRRTTATRFDQRKTRLSWPRLNLLKIARSVYLSGLLLRDAYVDMMLRWSRSPSFATKTITDAGMSAFRKVNLKEYDEKVIVELYRLILLTQSQDKAAAMAIGWIPGHVREENKV